MEPGDECRLHQGAGTLAMTGHWNRTRREDTRPDFLSYIPNCIWNTQRIRMLIVVVLLLQMETRPGQSQCTSGCQVSIQIVTASNLVTCSTRPGIIVETELYIAFFVACTLFYNYEKIQEKKWSARILNLFLNWNKFAFGIDDVAKVTLYDECQILICFARYSNNANWTGFATSIIIAVKVNTFGVLASSNWLVTTMCAPF